MKCLVLKDYYDSKEKGSLKKCVEEVKSEGREYVLNNMRYRLLGLNFVVAFSSAIYIFIVFSLQRAEIDLFSWLNSAMMLHVGSKYLQTNNLTCQDHSKSAYSVGVHV